MTGHYFWRLLPGLPAEGVVFAFSRQGERLIREGVVIEFGSGENVWTGNFAPAGAKRTEVYILGEQAFVIAGGAGYRVRLPEPARYEVLRPSLVVDSCYVPELEMVILAGPTNVCAYDASHCRWCTPDLSTDGVKLQACNASGITGVAERYQGDEPHWFTIDPVTGRVRIGPRY